MDYNHKDVVIFISRIIAKIINYCLLFIGICVAGVILYGFYIFIFQPYPPGQDPLQKWWKERKEKAPSSAYVPALKTTSGKKLISSNLQKMKAYLT